MRPIPTKQKERMAKKREYQPGYCKYHRKVHGPHVKTEWHHNLMYMGRQVNKEWSILNICQEIHRRVHEPEIRDILDWIMLNRAPEEELKEYSGAVDLIKRRDKLNQKIGKYEEIR